MADRQTISDPGVAVAPAEPAKPVAERRPPWRGIAETASWVVVFAALIVGWGWWQTGTLSLVWPYLQGERLLFDPQHVVIESVPGGTIVERPVRVLNRSSSDVKLLGSQQSCGCITLDEFPILIPAGGVHTLTLKLAASSEELLSKVVFSRGEERRRILLRL